MDSYRHTATVTSMEFRLRTSATGLQPLRGDLFYDPADPFAVRVDFHTSRGAIRWMFCRDMLADGLIAPMGEGDIRVRPGADSSTVIVELQLPGRSTVLEAHASDLAEFLDRTYRAVPPGTEADWFDIDAELADIML